MFFTKKIIDYLSLYQIAPIIESYLISKNPSIKDELEGLDTDSKISVLAGTPQWTYLQIIDQYLVCGLGKRQYNVLLRQQEILGLNILPYRFSTGILYIKKFFEFQLYQRQMNNKSIDELLNRSSMMKISGGSNELSYLKQLIRLLQEYELMDDNPNYYGSTEEIEAIKEQLDDNEDLFNFYLSYRPELLR